MVMPNNVSKRIYIFGAIGALFCIFGTTIFFTWPAIFRSILHSQMQVTEGSHTFALWRDTPVPMYMSFYFHNWTNPHELNIRKPKLQQMGPYRFNIEEKKTHIVMNSNGTVTFRIARKWFFDTENSNGTLDDIVTTLNAVAISAASTAKDWSRFMTGPLSLTIKQTGQKVYIQKKVGDLLFFGYNDPLIDIAGTLPAFVGVDLPFDKFAWFYKRNESSDFEGVLNMDTGFNDIYQLGRLHYWNYNNVTNFYDEPCGMVNGSAGELFPPNQTKEKGIEFYSPDLCRSLKLAFTNEEVIHGITGYKYAGNEYCFDNGTLDPRNECFCNGICSPSGVLNVTACRYGAPGFISFPHYYLADQYYRDQVDGMRPDGAKHSLYITLEPETGIPLDVAARFQINILLFPIEKISLFKNVPTIYFPMIWFEQRATITKSLAWQVKFALASPVIGQIMSFLFIAGGIAMVVYYMYLIVSFTRRFHDFLKAVFFKLGILISNISLLLFCLKHQSAEIDLREFEEAETLAPLKTSKETIIDLKEEPIIKPLINSNKKIQISTAQELLPKTTNGLKVEEKLNC